MTERFPTKQELEDVGYPDSVKMVRTILVLRAELEAAKCTLDDEIASHQDTLRLWNALRAERAKPTPSDAKLAKDTIGLAVLGYRHDDGTGDEVPGVTWESLDRAEKTIAQAFTSIRAEGSAERAKLEAALEARIKHCKENAAAYAPGSRDNWLWHCIADNLIGFRDTALAPPAESGATERGFTAYDYSHLASLLRENSEDPRLKAIMSNNFSVILGALDVAAGTKPMLAHTRRLVITIWGINSVNWTKAIANTALMIGAVAGAHFWPAETIALVIMLNALATSHGAV
jgi:hypothetical protein